MTRASDTARLVSGGAVFNEASNDVDFRVESNGDANMLFVDAGNDRVYLGRNATDGVGNARLQIEAQDGEAGLSIHRGSASTGGGAIFFSKSRGATAGDDTVVQSGDELGKIFFTGADGTDRESAAAEIKVEVDATPGGNDMPGRIVFGTTADGASSVTERMRIDSGGVINHFTSPASNSNSPIGLKLINDGSGSGTGSRITMGAGDAGLSRSAGISGFFDGTGTTMAFHTSPSYGNDDQVERARISAAGLISFFKTSFSETADGVHFDPSGLVTITRANGTCFVINRQSADGTIVDFRNANSTEGTIGISGSTVSYNGFSGLHESSGIASNVAIGTVVSTIDELDVYPSKQKSSVDNSEEDHPKAGQTRADHAKIKISDSVGDKRVYGVLQSYDDNGKPLVASVGIGSIRVTGACEGGDLLESNGDGTAKVQSDDIIRSKTIGKVTIGNSSTDVKLVSCVLYCG